MDPSLGDFLGCLPLLFGRSCWGLRIYRGHGVMLNSSTGNSARYSEPKYRGGDLGGVELYSGRAPLQEASLALGRGFYPFGIFGRVPEAAESLTAFAVGISSLGVGSAFSYSSQRGDGLS